LDPFPNPWGSRRDPFLGPPWGPLGGPILDPLLGSRLEPFGGPRFGPLRGPLCCPRGGALGDPFLGPSRGPLGITFGPLLGPLWCPFSGPFLFPVWSPFAARFGDQFGIRAGSGRVAILLPIASFPARLVLFAVLTRARPTNGIILGPVSGTFVDPLWVPLFAPFGGPLGGGPFRAPSGTPFGPLSGSLLAPLRGRFGVPSGAPLFGSPWGALSGPLGGSFWVPFLAPPWGTPFGSPRDPLWHPVRHHVAGRSFCRTCPALVSRGLLVAAFGVVLVVDGVRVTFELCGCVHLRCVRRSLARFVDGRRGRELAGAQFWTVG
jgi:hypothetical protein